MAWGGPRAADGAEGSGEPQVASNGAGAHADVCAEKASAAATSGDPSAELYRQFQCHFRLQQYAAALPYLQRACRAKESSPSCLLNLGAVHHALLHCELAHSYYVRYLDSAPYGEAREAAGDAIAELDVICEPPTLPVPVEASSGRDEHAKPVIPSLAPGAVFQVQPPPPTADTSGWQEPVGWVLIGAGAASGIASVVSLLQGARASDDAERRDRDNGGLGLRDDPELRAIDRHGTSRNHLAIGFGVASAALVGAGAALWFFSPVEGISGRVGADGSAEVSWSASF